MPTILPNYDLSLKQTENTEDVPGLTFTGNANFVEIEDYVNAIKHVVEEIVITPNVGLTEAQVRAVITSTRLRRLIDGAKHSAVGLVIYNPGLPTEYTVTYSTTTDGKHQYVISNPYPTEASFVECKSSDGFIEFPNVQCSGNNVIVQFTYKLSINTTKFVIIF